MESRQEQAEKRGRAERLKQARKQAGKGSYRKLATNYGWNENTYKSHESGANGFTVTDARRYAKVFKVSFDWLYFGTGEMHDTDIAAPKVDDIPLISFVSAGQLTDQTEITDFDHYPTVAAIDLPQGNWIALRVEGDSMNKISPPDSVIFVNLSDRRLVPNACYVVADERGAATYKRYRPNDNPPFQPASYHELPAPVMSGAIRVIGRVRRTVLDI